MGSDEKVARHRLSVLELAEQLGNVSEACRRRGMHKSQFYEFKRRFQTHGLEGLKEPSPGAQEPPDDHPRGGWSGRFWTRALRTRRGAACG